jgi:4-hydroxy-2-oxoheptanedioate aldolase
VPGIDAVFIGPNDLAASMGYPSGYEREDRPLVEAISRVREVAASHGVASGIHASDGSAVARRIAEGFRFIAMGSDARLLQTAAKIELKAAR